MGAIVGYLTHALLVVGGTLLVSFLIRDAYACANLCQKAILRLASMLIPKGEREEMYRQWHGDIRALPPSELLRSLYAIDFLRAAFVIGVLPRIEHLVAAFSPADFDTLSSPATAQSLPSFLMQQRDIAATLSELAIGDSLMFTLDIDRASVTMTATKYLFGFEWSKPKLVFRPSS
jgi:hypothetical protein